MDYQRRKGKFIFCITLAFFLLGSCNTQKNISLDELKKQPERKLETYNSSLDLPVLEKIQIPPKFILDYLNRMDGTDTYTGYTLTDDGKKQFSEYFGYLPGQFQDVINKKVIAIYFISNFLGGGMSDFLFDKDGTMYTVLFFNPAILHTTLSDWITKRDNAPFLENSAISIQSYISSEFSGLLHVLLHEAAHVYDYYYHVTPYLSVYLITDTAKSSTAFTKNIWKAERTPAGKYNILHNTKYSGWGLNRQIDKNISIPLYQKIAQTPFSSLYGTLAWYEDFAETFTWYYLYKIFNITYRTVVIKDGFTAAEYCPTENPLMTKRYEQFSGFNY